MINCFTFSLCVFYRKSVNLRLAKLMTERRAFRECIRHCPCKVCFRNALLLSSSIDLRQKQPC